MATKYFIYYKYTSIAIALVNFGPLLGSDYSMVDFWFPYIETQLLWIDIYMNNLCSSFIKISNLQIVSFTEKFLFHNLIVNMQNSIMSLSKHWLQKQQIRGVKEHLLNFLSKNGLSFKHRAMFSNGRCYTNMRLNPYINL